MNGFPMDGAPVGAGSQTLCLPCLHACFCCDFWLCSCSLMVVVPTNLVALNLGSKLQEDLENPYTLSTLPTYNCLLPLCILHGSTFFMWSKDKNHLSLLLSLSLSHFDIFLQSPGRPNCNCMFIGLPRQGYCVWIHYRVI
jgi:hypothetical protein